MLKDCLHTPEHLADMNLEWSSGDFREQESVCRGLVNFMLLIIMYRVWSLSIYEVSRIHPTPLPWPGAPAQHPGPGPRPGPGALAPPVRSRLEAPRPARLNIPPSPLLSAHPSQTYLALVLNRHRHFAGEDFLYEMWTVRSYRWIH